MSWSSIKDYFRARLSAQGLTEWPDPFDAENIPLNLTDESYTFDMGEFIGVSRNQHNQETTSSINIKIILKGMRDIAEAEDRGIALAENIVKDSVKASNVATSGLHNVVFLRMNPQPFSTENESLILIEMEFETRVILEL